MKKIFFVVALLGSLNGAYAQNTFPTDPGTNAGIGTTNPTTGRLVINTGVAAPASALDIRNTGGGADNNAAITWAGGAYGFIDFNANSVQGVRYSALGPLVFGANTNAAYGSSTFTEWMRVTPTGNFGIGTTSPATALHVKTTNNTVGFSNLTVENSGATGNEAGIAFKGGYTTTSLNSGRIYSLFDGGTSYSSARTTIQSMLSGGVYDNTLTVRNAKVGVGTVNPVAFLHVNDVNTATSTRGNVFIGTTDAATVDAGGQLGFGGSYTGTTQTSWAGLAGRKENATDGDYSGYLQFITRKNGTATAERARITSDGSLGVGTTTPGLKTHINGVSGFPATTGTAQTGVLRLQGLSNNAVLDFGVNGTSGAYLQATNQTALNANYPLLLNPNGGNVGIGVINPTDKLAVNGTIHTKEVRVDLTGWPDYVFTKDYKLLTLTVVKKYIDQNHHLPDMPSEKEIIAKGLNLGEMNKLLTKKVEELTLYLIEKDEELKKQQQEISSQKSDMDLLKQQMKELQTLVKK